MRRFTMTQDEINDTRTQARARFRAGHHPDVVRATQDETGQEDQGHVDEGPSQRDLIRGLVAKQAEQGSGQPQRRPSLFSRSASGGSEA